jgi:hypothetical protein
LTRARLAAFYAIVVFGSIAVALGAGELFVRTLAISSGDGGGRAAERWHEEYWKPVNAHGYRDVEWAPAGSKPALVFLGDSFTEGHGVAFADTYHQRVRTALADRYVGYALGKSGASTGHELRNYRKFRAATGVRPAVVVYQYFGNDMQERLPRAPQWQPWPGLETLSRHSELAELAWTYMAGVRYGNLYADHFFAAYDGPEYAPHRRTVERVFKETHADGARTVFVVFPYLDDDSMLERSQAAYVGKMREVFGAACAPGDAFLDVTPLAREFPPAQRKASVLDGHPSPALHARIAGLLEALIDARADAPPAGFEACPAATDGRR